MSRSLMVEEVEDALLGIAERLKGEGLIAAVARDLTPPVYPRVYVLLREVHLARTTVAGSGLNVDQEYEVVVESSGPDAALQASEAVRAAVRFAELVLSEGPREVGGLPLELFPYELRVVDVLESGRRSTVVSVRVRARVG
ncbi:MAG: hypothetical protein ABDH63_04075 [Candidatus Caldarchaeales archaeon]